jgi:hypothetical protein
LSRITDHAELLHQRVAVEQFADARGAGGLQVIDPLLSNVARRYMPDGFIYDQIVARQPVGTISGLYPTFPKGYWFAQVADNKIDDRTETKEVNFEWSTEKYLAQKYGLKVSISDDERANAAPQLRLEQNKTEFLSTQQALSREIRLANALRDTTHGGGLTEGHETTPSKKWDTSESNPDADLRTAALEVYNAIGRSPNTLILPYPVAYNLATQHGTDTFRGQMLYTVNGDQMIRLGDGVLPSEIHGMKVVIPKGPQKITAGEPYAGATTSEIWGKNAILAYVDPNAGWGNPTCIYGFQFMAPTIARWQRIDPDVEYISEMERVDEKIVAPDAAWVLSAVIS